VTSAHPDKPFPILIGSREIYNGRIIKVRVDEIEIANGLNVRREVVLHPGAVVIVPIDEEGRIHWVRQYRYAAGRTLLELPAGTLEAGEEPLACARRECQEETGHSAGEWTALGGFFSAPGFSSEYLYVFAAADLSPADAHPDDDEDIEVVTLTVEESLARLERGEIEDAKSIAALFMWLQKRKPGI
jgi:ADP-ribose pyrophosphatase